MSDRKLETTALVLVVQNLSGLTAKCRFCGAALRYGRFAIGLRLESGDHLVIRDAPDVCCHQEHLVPMLFQDRHTAAETAYRIFGEVQRNRSLAGVKLVEWHPFKDVDALRMMQ